MNKTQHFLRFIAHRDEGGKKKETVLFLFCFTVSLNPLREKCSTFSDLSHHEFKKCHLSAQFRIYSRMSNAWVVHTQLKKIRITVSNPCNTMWVDLGEHESSSELFTSTVNVANNPL